MASLTAVKLDHDLKAYYANQAKGKDLLALEKTAQRLIGLVEKEYHLK